MTSAMITELQHTLGHLDCPACEGARRAMMYGAALGELSFPSAATQWLRTRRSISDNTRKGYEEHIGLLSTFFGKMRLNEIHIGHLRSYQQMRQDNIRVSRRHQAGKRQVAALESDGASRINHEISCLGQVLKIAGLWEELKKFYEPLPLPKGSPGIALTTEEEKHLFQVARSRPRWMLAYCCALISRNTTAGPGEIRHLRLCDVDLDSQAGSFLHVEEGVKNEFRKRPIPLNSDAAKAVRWLLERAAGMGAREPLHYLLPHRAHHLGAAPDPTKPMGSWKKAHYAMCEEAAKKFPRLASLRLYDYRHTAMTDLLEDPAVSYTTIEHMAGHRINSNTKRKYDHLRNSALRVAANVLNRSHVPAEEVELERKPSRRENVQTFAARTRSYSS